MAFIGLGGAPLWRKTPCAAADGLPSRPVLTFLASDLMLCKVYHIAKEKSSGIGGKVGVGRFGGRGDAVEV